MLPKQSSSLKKAPHSRANYVDSENLLAFGARPEQFTIEEIKSSNPSLIISLEEEKPWYEITKVIHLPTKSGKVPNKIQAELVAQTAIDFLNKGEIVFVHCSGGHGRAGTMAALIYGKWKGVDAGEAIKVVSKSKENRADTSRNFIPTPETNAQVKFLEQILGGKGPDRSDMSWLRRVKKERKIDI